MASVATINLAYIALLAAAFCLSIQRVRLLLVIAAALFVAYGLVESITSMVVWNLIVGGLNFYRLVRGAWEEALTREHGRAEQGMVSATVDWLRTHLLRRRGLPTVGIALDDEFVAISMRDEPLRITGLFRQRLDGFGGGPREDQLYAAAERARRKLRMPIGTPAIVALTAGDRPVGLPLEQGCGERSTRAPREDPALLRSLERAGFRVELLDDLFAPRDRRSLDAVPVDVDLRQVDVARSIRLHLDAERDATAIGAALQMYRRDPGVGVQTADRHHPKESVIAANHLRDLDVPVHESSTEEGSRHDSFASSPPVAWSAPQAAGGGGSPRNRRDLDARGA